MGLRGKSILFLKVYAQQRSKNVYNFSITIKLPLILLKTFLYGLKCLGKDPQTIGQIKTQWAQMVFQMLKFQVEIKGGPLPQESMVLVGSHLSFLDIPLLMMAVPEIVFISKDDLLRWPIVGRSAKAAGTIFVNRAKAQAQRGIAQQLSEVLKGFPTKLVIFPSGTTTLDENKPWKKGAFTIAKFSQVRVQLFRIEYEPQRACAYIDDDHFLRTLIRLFKIKNKKATLTWLGCQEVDTDPATFAETMRQQLLLQRQGNSAAVH